MHVSHHVHVEELGGGGEEEEVTKAGGGESIGRAQRQHHEWLADLQPYALCMASRDHAHARITPQPARKLDMSSSHQHGSHLQSVVYPLCHYKKLEEDICKGQPEGQSGLVSTLFHAMATVRT